MRKKIIPEQINIIIKFMIIILLVLLNNRCCRTSCINILPANPMALSTQIMIEKTEAVIESAINYYCEKGKWPASKDDIAKFGGSKKKLNISDFNKLEFNRQGDKKMNINFDIFQFDHQAFHIEKYSGFCDIFIKNSKACMDENSVELYVSEFIIYNKKSSDKKPLNIPSPIIIKFDNFKNRTIASIQHGYET